MSFEINESGNAGEHSQPSFKFTETQDWFSGHIPAWENWVKLVANPTPRVLEIGSWEGRSGVWLLATLCSQGGSLVCIDHFDLMQTADGRGRYARIKHNLSLTGKEYRILPMFSAPALFKLLEEEIKVSEPGFDWIYVDGSHEADDTFLDGELAWRVARQGAIVIFDDYLWKNQPIDSIHHPKRGIDTFLALHVGQYERLSDAGAYQVVLRKTSDMRIGFLSGDGTPESVKQALEYGINIVFTIDSAYAMPAAIAIRSALERTAGRITVYIVDCGLVDQDRKRIQDSIPQRADVSLRFLSLAEGNLTAELGPSWAKIDMLSVLPVERALYMDADVLVQESLVGLWDTDLQAKPIGAVADVGLPTGYEGFHRGPYFNAGILLLDLARIRQGLRRLTELEHDMRATRFADQDVLNVHFRDDWHALPHEWNAQGLGTYAESASPERDPMMPDLRRARLHPYIIHFTGPIHPPMSNVLNPYVQPFTAKQWGYAGAPGHPYTGEWWAVLERTEWKGLRSQPAYMSECLAARDHTIEEGVEQFKKRVKESAMKLE